MNELVYIFSGMALQTDTSRYLIMLAPILVLIIASCGSLPKIHYGFGLLLVVITINGIKLTSLVANNWDIHFPVDHHLEIVAQYLNEHNNSYAYGSMDTATPLAYYGGVKTGATIAPLACAGKTLQKADAFRETLLSKKTYQDVAIILDGDAIRNAPSVCSLNDIEAQFGPPINNDRLADGSLVLLYQAESLQTLK